MTLTEQILKAAEKKGLAEDKIQKQWIKLGGYGSWKAGNVQRQQKLLEVLS